jgi:hypothetical protein
LRIINPVSPVRGPIRFDFRKHWVYPFSIPSQAMIDHISGGPPAAVVLSSVYGASFSFTDYGDSTENLAPRTFSSFEQAAQEAG